MAEEFLVDAARKILLTGGAGFIGSHVAEALVRGGAKLTIVDSLDPFYSPAWKRANLEDVRRVGRFEFFEADICHAPRVREIFRAFRPDTVIHLAARAGVRPSIEQPQLYERVNVSGTLNLLDLCREFRVQNFIFGSSSSVYGAASKAPFVEGEMNLQPISPYAATKIAGEMLCCTYAHLYPMSMICLRFFTVYGPRQRPDLAIHKFTALIEAGKPVPVYGDGSAGRDYTFVTDVVAGVFGALEFTPPVTNGARFEIFNLGNSHPVTLNEMIAAIEQVIGRKANRSPQPMQPGDVPLTWADLTKSKAALGYSPATTFEEGIKKFVEWYRSVSPSRHA
jgi:UDP-glucuronate 4-epimerase